MKNSRDWDDWYSDVDIDGLKMVMMMNMLMMMMVMMMMKSVTWATTASSRSCTPRAIATLILIIMILTSVPCAICYLTDISLLFDRNNQIVEQLLPCHKRRHCPWPQSRAYELVQHSPPQCPGHSLKAMYIKVFHNFRLLQIQFQERGRIFTYEIKFHTCTYWAGRRSCLDNAVSRVKGNLEWKS